MTFPITHNEFLILRSRLQGNQSQTQRELADQFNLSLGSINNIIHQLRNKSLIDGNDNLMEKGLVTLSEFKVDNAIIMAAGTSSRFAPLSYDKPKGLLKVHDEVLIERQIQQLRTAGISNIILVLGYMKEQFFYLEKKFGIKIIINEDYYRYNNTSTLMHVLPDMKNSYICSSDNYYTKNPFHAYEYKAYYPIVKGTANLPSEYYVALGSNNKITNIVIGKGELFLIGYAYFDRFFSDKFSKILKERYTQDENVKINLWEKILIENIQDLEIAGHIVDPSTIKEFDCLSDLQNFDPFYINNTDNKILENIIETFQCKVSDIQSILPLKEGMTNLSFCFEVNKEKYVYRHPGIGTDAYIDRNAEYDAQIMAKKIHLDDAFICMNKNQGWKISHFISDAHLLNYHNKDEVTQSLQAIKNLHDLKITEGYSFNLWNKTQNYFNNIINKSRTSFEGFDRLSKTMQQLHLLTEKSSTQKVLCHCDLFNTNILFSKGKCYIIDWEYAGLEDPAIDLGIFIASSDYSYEEALEVLEIYYGGKMPAHLLKHFVAYIALSAYYCFAWALYQDSRGAPVGEYLYIWHKYALFYSEKALELYNS